MSDICEALRLQNMTQGRHFKTCWLQPPRTHLFRQACNPLSSSGRRSCQEDISELFSYLRRFHRRWWHEVIRTCDRISFLTSSPLSSAIKAANEALCGVEQALKSSAAHLEVRLCEEDQGPEGRQLLHPFLHGRGSLEALFAAGRDVDLDLDARLERQPERTLQYRHPVREQQSAADVTLNTPT